MAHEDHLTIEQLSAYLDGQLSQQEQAECDAHLQVCRQCRGMLADLRQTVSLLHALPQPELPRSLVLPVRTLSAVAGSERRPAPITPITRAKGRSWQSNLRRSTRVISMIAAVLGIFVITSSLLTGLLSISHGGAATSASAPSFATASNKPEAPVPSSGNAGAPGRVPRGTTTVNQAGDEMTPTPSPIPPTPAPTPANSLQTSAQPPSLPPLLNVTMLEGRVALGIILLLLGIVGVIFTRRREARRSG